MQRIRDCGVARSKMSLIHPLPSKLRDHYQREVRLTQEPEAAEGKQYLPGKARPLHTQIQAVTACTRYSQDPASQNPSMAGGGAHEAPPHASGILGISYCLVPFLITVIICHEEQPTKEAFKFPHGLR